MTSPACPDTLRFVSTDVTGKTHITFLFILFSREPDFFSVDDNDKISGVDVWGKNRFFFPAQQVGGLHRDAAEHLVLSVNDPPLAWRFVSFGGKRLHGRKRARKLRVTRLNVNLRAPLATYESYATHMSHHRYVHPSFHKNRHYAPTRRRFSGVVPAGNSRR